MGITNDAFFGALEPRSCVLVCGNFRGSASISFSTPFGGRNGAVTALHAYGTSMNDGPCSSATLGPSHAGPASTPDHGHTL